MLYNIDRRLCQIKHTPTQPFENVNIIFCGDFYQAQLVCDNWIFEDPTINGEKIPHRFWLENVLCFKLQTIVRQTHQQFISILNHTRIGKQNDKDLSYLNMTCYKTPPNNQKLPYLFHRNSIVDEHNKRMLDF